MIEKFIKCRRHYLQLCYNMNDSDRIIGIDNKLYPVDYRDIYIKLSKDDIKSFIVNETTLIVMVGDNIAQSTNIKSDQVIHGYRVFSNSSNISSEHYIYDDKASLVLCIPISDLDTLEEFSKLVDMEVSSIVLKKTIED